MKKFKNNGIMRKSKVKQGWGGVEKVADIATYFPNLIIIPILALKTLNFLILLHSLKSNALREMNL